MKTIVIGLLLLGIIFPIKGQIDLEKIVKKKTEKRAKKRTEQGVDKGLDKVEGGIKSLFGKEEDKNRTKEEGTKDHEEPSDKTLDNKSMKPGSDQQTNPLLNWSKYDFVPGTKIIFEDNQEGEENGEFPSRWDLIKGRVENAVFDSSKVIYFMTGSSTIIPYLKEREHDYLPEEFTIEFDAWFESNEYTSYYIWFADKKNQQYDSELWRSSLRVSPNFAKYKKYKGMYPGKSHGWENDGNSFWRHVAISFNRRALKVYLDDARVLNIPNMEINPTGITIAIDNFGTGGVKGYNRFIKNTRVAKGAVELYDKLQQTGKIITNAIRFDTGKSTLKPESMGIINEIAELMQKHPDIKFSVEGHTDNVGENDYNQKLSEKRAATVVERLKEMGIESNRLTSKGFGKTNAIQPNDTSEGRAENRRVEFVKL